MADPRFFAPPTPELTAAVRARYTGQVRGALPEMELVVPLQPGTPSAEQAPTASFVPQWRVWLDVDDERPEDWVTNSAIDVAGPLELAIRGPQGLVLVDARVIPVSATGIPGPALVVAERLDLYGTDTTPTDLSLEDLVVTDASGSRRVLRVEWSGSAEELYVVRYRHDADPWRTTEPQPDRVFDIHPLAQGRWEVEVRAQSNTGVLSSAATAQLTVRSLGSSNFDLPTPSGLELVGPEGELLGSGREWVGRDVKIRWSELRADALVTTAVGTAPADQLLEFVVVKVRDPSTGFLLREEHRPITATEYAYPYAMNEEDGVRRSLQFEVAYKDVTGRLSTFAPILVGNPAPNAPGGVTAIGRFSKVVYIVDLPANPDPDLSGLLVWADTDPDFEPADEFLVADRAVPVPGSTPFVVGEFDAISDQTIYVRCAFYDAFTKDPAQLNVSAAEEVVIPLVQTLDLESGAAQQYSLFSQSSSFSLLDANGETETYGPVEFDTVDADTLVVPRYVFRLDFNSTYVNANDTNRYVVELLRRPVGVPASEVVVDTTTFDFHFTLPNPASGPTDTMRVTIPTFSAVDVVGSAGSWEYRLRVTAQSSGSAFLSLQLVTLKLEALVVRR